MLKVEGLVEELQGCKVARLQSLVGRGEELESLRSETTKTIQATSEKTTGNDESDGAISSDLKRLLAISSDDENGRGRPPGGPRSPPAPPGHPPPGGRQKKLQSCKVAKLQSLVEKVWSGRRGSR